VILIKEDVVCVVFLLYFIMTTVFWQVKSTLQIWKVTSDIALSS